jgi:hypothetical protein
MIKSSRSTKRETKSRKTFPKHYIDLVFQSTPSLLKKQAETPLNIKNSFKNKQGYMFLFDKPLFKGRSISLSKLSENESLKQSKFSNNSGSSLARNLITQTSRNFLIEGTTNCSAIDSLMNKKVQSTTRMHKVQKQSFHEIYHKKLGIIKKSLQIKKIIEKIPVVKVLV